VERFDFTRPQGWNNSSSPSRSPESEDLIPLVTGPHIREKWFTDIDVLRGGDDEGQLASRPIAIRI